MNNEQLQERIEEMEAKFEDAISQIKWDLQELKTRVNYLEYTELPRAKSDIDNVERNVNNLERQVSSLEHSTRYR